MLFLYWLVLCLAAASLILLPLVLWRHQIFERYSGSRSVTCPENQQSAVVSIDAMHAAATGVDGLPDLRLSDCTRWPERANCDQGCLSGAVHAKPYTPAEVKVRTKQIYHLPILLAAFVAWYLGLIWHAQYMFRPQWLDAAGFTRAQVAQPGWWNSWHLLAAAVCLLFAYGVAWLLAMCHRKGVLQGMLMSILLCGAIVATNGYGITKLPHAVLVIEAGYTALAAILVGAIVGGLKNKLVLTSHSSSEAAEKSGIG